MSQNIVCSDPAHAGRSGEAGWAAVLGVADRLVTGMLCPACANHIHDNDVPNARAAAQAQVNDTASTGMALRGIVAVLVDEINLLREWVESFKAATAAATNLANLQTRVAALSAMPDRTLTQARNAIQAKINAGNVDS